MPKKCSLKLSVILMILISSLNVGAMSELPKLPSLSSLNIREKVSDMIPRKRGGSCKSKISDDTLNRCLKNLNEVITVKEGSKNTLNIRWITRLYTIVRKSNCSPDNFIERIKPLPIFVDQSDKNTHCPYCNSLVKNKYCTDQKCISHWVIAASNGGFKGKPRRLGDKSGWRERLCLLPAILLEICRDSHIESSHPAKAWAIHQLMEGKETEWSYVDKLFNGLSYSTTRVSEIKKLLNSTYESISIDDVIDACLYYENCQ